MRDEDINFATLEDFNEHRNRINLRLRNVCHHSISHASSVLHVLTINLSFIVAVSGLPLGRRGDDSGGCSMLPRAPPTTR